MQGYIKLYRQFIEWEWYSNINVSRLFLHCLLRANHEEKKWQGKIINKGQFVTSYDHLSKETGLSIQNIRTCLNKLKSTGELTYKSTSQYSIITVNNWDRWQAEQQANQQATNKQLTTNKNDKNEKNINNNYFSVPTKKQIEDYVYLLGKHIDIDSFIAYYDASDWCDKCGLPINWQQKAVSWANRYQPKQETNIRKFKTKEEIEMEHQEKALNAVHQMFVEMEEKERGQQ